MKVVVKVKQEKAMRPLTKEDIQEAVYNGIIQANAQSDSPVSTPAKNGFWKKIWRIIKGKESKDGVYASILFAGILESFFNILAVMGFLGQIALIVAAILQIGAMTWVKNQIWTNIATIFSMMVIEFLVFVFTLMFRGAANDMKQEKDRNYIAALFFGLVSFVALIVSAIPLIPGVG